MSVQFSRQRSLERIQNRAENAARMGLRVLPPAALQALDDDMTRYTMSKTRWVAPLAAVITLLAGVGASLANDAISPVPCVSFAEWEGFETAETPEAALAVFTATVGGQVLVLTGPDQERMGLVATTAAAAQIREQAPEVVVFSTVDAAGNTLGEFSVLRNDDGSWRVATLSVGLPRALCDALEERL